MNILRKIKTFITGVRYHRVTYYAFGFMGNKYKVLTVEFTSNRKERSKFGCVSRVGFYKNHRVLERHFKTSNGRITYWYKEN